MPANKKSKLQVSAASYLPVSWQGAPANVHAYTTLRAGGYSSGNFSSYNLATHVSDDESLVAKNRQKLAQDLTLPSLPVWLNQTHSDRVILAEEVSKQSMDADASIARTKGVVCAVLTADCLPVFFCNRTGTEVAVAHAGWRGMHAGIITKTVEAMHSAIEDIVVSLGPAIGQQSFEVDAEVFSAFIEKDINNKAAFVTTRDAHYNCDLYQIAKNELWALGLTDVNGGGYCTYQENARFYSYRKQPITGRMANIIWFE